MSQRDWEWGCALWGWGGEGSQEYRDGVRMEKKSWGWGRNGADFQYRVTLYSSSLADKHAFSPDLLNDGPANGSAAPTRLLVRPVVTVSSP